MIALAYVLLPIALIGGDGSAWGLLGLLCLPLAAAPVRAVRERTDGPALNGALAGTGALLGAFALLVAVGLLI
jgi:1,4-dihydroxy-2-naphthoate octaprenyltransferase